MRTKASENSGAVTMFGDKGIESGITKAALGPILERLTDMYADPAIATVREVISNGHDAVVKRFGADSAQRGVVTVTLPSLFNDYTMSFKDNGTGMDKDTAVYVAAQFGESSKTTDLSATGAFGLGFKAPFAYVNRFHCKTVKEQVSTSFTFDRQPGQVPRILGLTTEDAPGEEPGTTISFTLTARAAENVNLFRTTIMMRNFATDFKVAIENEDEIPVGIKNSLAGCRAVSLDETFVHVDDIEHEGESYRLFVRKDFPVEHGYSYYAGRDLDNLASEAGYLLNGFMYGASNPKFIIELKVGVVDFPSSRDTILENGRFASLRSSITEHIEAYASGDDLPRKAYEIAAVKYTAEVLSACGDDSYEDSTLAEAFVRRVIRNSRTDQALKLIKEVNDWAGKTDAAGNKISLSEKIDYIGGELHKTITEDNAFVMDDGKLKVRGAAIVMQGSRKGVYDGAVRYGSIRKSEMNAIMQDYIQLYLGKPASSNILPSASPVAPIDELIGRLVLMVTGEGKGINKVIRGSGRIEVGKTLHKAGYESEDSVGKSEGVVMFVPAPGGLSDEALKALDFVVSEFPTFGYRRAVETPHVIEVVDGSEVCFREVARSSTSAAARRRRISVIEVKQEGHEGDDIAFAAQGDHKALQEAFDKEGICPSTDFSYTTINDTLARLESEGDSRQAVVITPPLKSSPTISDFAAIVSGMQYAHREALESGETTLTTMNPAVLADYVFILLGDPITKAEYTALEKSNVPVVLHVDSRVAEKKRPVFFDEMYAPRTFAYGDPQGIVDKVFWNSTTDENRTYIAAIADDATNRSPRYLLNDTSYYANALIEKIDPNKVDEEVMKLIEGVRARSEERLAEYSDVVDYEEIANKLSVDPQLTPGGAQRFWTRNPFRRPATNYYVSWSEMMEYSPSRGEDTALASEVASVISSRKLKDWDYAVSVLKQNNVSDDTIGLALKDMVNAWRAE